MAAIDRFAFSRNGGGNVDEKCLLRVNIPGISTAEKRVRYQVDVTNVQTRQTWRVLHRYSEFLALHDELLKFFATAVSKCPGCVNYEKVVRLFEFPRKRYFTSDSPVVINYRKKALRAFAALLASHTFSTSPKCPTCGGYAFTAVRDFFTEEGTLSSDDKGSICSTPGSTRSTVRDAIKVKDFTNYVPVSAIKTVNSEGHFIRDEDVEKKPQERVKATSSNGKGGKKQSAKMPSSAARSTTSSGSTSSSASRPTSPATLSDTAVPVVVKDADQEVRGGSFVSFSGSDSPLSPTGTDHAQEDMPPPGPLSPTTTMTKKESKKRCSSSNKKRVSSSSRANGSDELQAETSTTPRESMDDEFGSLDMSFMSSISSARSSNSSTHA